jgi:hypothetical protein
VKLVEKEEGKIDEDALSACVLIQFEIKLIDQAELERPNTNNDLITRIV